jgi:hypothetical protein
MRSGAKVAYSWEKLQDKDFCLQWAERSRNFDKMLIAKLVLGATGEIGKIEAVDLEIVGELDGSESILLHNFFDVIRWTALEVFGC